MHVCRGNKGAREDLAVVSLLAMRTLVGPCSTVLQRVCQVSVGTATTQSFHMHMRRWTDQESRHKERPCTLDHRTRAATRLRWYRRRQPPTRPGPPSARRSPSAASPSISTAGHDAYRVFPATRMRRMQAPQEKRRECRECCLLVLNLVSSTLPCIRQPRPRLRVLDVCGFV